MCQECTDDSHCVGGICNSGVCEDVVCPEGTSFDEVTSTCIADSVEEEEDAEGGELVACQSSSDCEDPAYPICSENTCSECSED